MLLGVNDDVPNVLFNPTTISIGLNNFQTHKSKKL